MTKRVPIEPQNTANQIHIWAKNNGVFIPEGLAEDLAKKLITPERVAAPKTASERDKLKAQLADMTMDCEQATQCATKAEGINVMLLDNMREVLNIAQIDIDDDALALAALAEIRPLLRSAIAAAKGK